MAKRFPIPRLALAFTLAALLAPSASGAGGSGSAATRPAPSTTATFRNPVIDENFPDPFILRVGNTYHAYSTNSGNDNVPHVVSRDLVHWERAGDALPVLPDWANGGRTWAPEVAHIGNHFVLYFTAADRASGRQCIGAATATSPAGPFKDTSRKPLVCQEAEGGSIDPSPFQDVDGQRYLLWKNDGNCCNLPTNIYIQPLGADGLKLTGKATPLIHNFALWEGNVIEAPTLYRSGGVYYLLYSAGPYDSDLYAVGYATAPRVTGPYRKAPENPILVSKGAVAGPGHQAVIKDGAGKTWLAYHAWTAGRIGDAVGYRSLRLDPVTFAGGKVKVAGPTLTPQRAPTP
ncbi:glycoside hydrolase [Deinococcus metallilatus]|uniref:Beta-xylosidase n=1 Tax=Deinococcus metallilatus TaxID=1211322 RepID=A0AAJ5F3M1_9DEIO|nr:glycoside hydrolase family 43 protein [Deinococcus metallilatus]MBB5295233.1 beta-xylosidase [Deinococcus metallilatus]QBY08605.1 glycoside hydrolase [Deinococcus metallilatus]RXJ10484.1 glycoside hydrolase [Deinococcus metallilatus]TLK26455.1 glycoside hydrolase [Deinococcus metallilatus]GMA15007.1 glycoside hydrolase [Deinococcus metallilatus]